jgi:prophage antirepressor-like protein
MTHTPSPPWSGLLPFGSYSVRYILDPDSTAWLVARDVLRVLAKDISRNPGRHLTRVAEHDRSYRTILSAQGPQRSIVISPAAAVALTRQRKRPIDREVRAFLTHHAALLGIEAA